MRGDDRKAQTNKRPLIYQKEENKNSINGNLRRHIGIAKRVYS